MNDNKNTWDNITHTMTLSLKAREKKNSPRNLRGEARKEFLYFANPSFWAHM